MNISKRIISVVVAYFLIYVVWGSTYFFIGEALDGIPTFLLGAMRFSVAGLLLLLLCRLRHERIFNWRMIRHSVVCGIILLFIDQGVIMFAQRYVSSSLVAIVASSTAIWIMLLDVKAWRKTFSSPITAIGIVLGFVGVAMLYAEQLNNEISGSHGRIGMAILIGGCISWAIGTLYSKYYSGAEDVNQFADSAWQMLSASVLFWLCSFLSDEQIAVDIANVPMKAWLSLIYLIIFGSILAYSAYIWLLKVRPATEVATHAYVNPVVAVLLGVFLGGEDVSVVQLVGLAVILVSVMLTNRGTAIQSEQ